MGSVHKYRKLILQGSLLHILPIEVVFGGNVVENGSGLHQLHPVDLHHGHLIKHQTPIYWMKNEKRELSMICLL